MVQLTIKERTARREKISQNRDDLLMQSIPEPVVLKNDSPVKGLKLLSGSDLMVIGLETGVVKIINRKTMQVVGENKLMDTPVLKIEQVQ